MTIPNTPNDSSKPGRLDRTRQQLQELDDLLQHMLSLPMAGEPETAAPAAEQQGAEKNTPKRLVSIDVPRTAGEAPKASLAKAPQPLQAAPAKPSVSDSAPPCKVESSTAEPPASPPVLDDQNRTSYSSLITANDDVSASELDLSGPGSMDLSGPADLMTPDFRELEALESRLSVQAPPKRSGAYGMLLNIDRAYDHAVDSLGPLGRPLASPGGKMSLGRIGILCLLGAAAVALGMWLGWLSV